MKFLTVAQMRAADQAAVAVAQIAEMTLMLNAGTALARVVTFLSALRKVRNVVLIAGGGNNGGDCFVAAHALHLNGLRVQVVMTCTPAKLKGVAHEVWDEMRTAGVPYVVLASEQSWGDDLSLVSGMLLTDGIIVDGIIGSGCRGAPRGVNARAIEWINHMRSVALVVAADLPSGMDGDSGATPGAVVRADLTLTFARPKSCFYNGRQAHLFGHLMVADIGIPPEVCDAATALLPCELIALPELKASFPRPLHRQHKGDNGRVLVLGGSQNYPHAPVLAALGAARGGAGLLTLAVPAASAAAAANWVPEAMLRHLELAVGTLTPDACQGLLEELNHFTVVVAGPGLGVTPGTLELTATLLEHSRQLVLDADGLNALAQLERDGLWHPRDGRQLILTPHPGEAARLLGCTVKDIEARRCESARELARRYRATVVLKGAGTLVATPEGRLALNLTGNPAMACGGMGDLLAGLVAALWARQDDAFNAAATAVWAHSSAADWATFSGSATTLSPIDVAGALRHCFRLLEA